MPIIRKRMKLFIFATILSVAFGINIRIKQEKEILPLSENVKIDTPDVKSLETIHKDGDEEDRVQIPYIMDQNKEKSFIPISENVKINIAIIKSMVENQKDVGKEETDDIPTKMDQAEVKGAYIS